MIRELGFSLVVALAIAPLSTGQCELDKVLAADGVADDDLGRSVAIDGRFAVVGAPFDDDWGDGSGSAYVFERQGKDWVQVAKLVAADGAPNDEFGRAVAISGDTVVVGARDDDDLGIGSGSVYVFDRVGGSWILSAKLLAGDGQPSTNFGQSVALLGDTCVVGAKRDHELAIGAGAVYVFDRLGGTWAQAAKLLSPDGASEDWFGYAAALDGDTLVVGALGHDHGSFDLGAAYVFQRAGGTWGFTQELLASDGSLSDHFGESVGVSGGLIVAGAPFDDDLLSTSGSAYVFELMGTTWVEVAKLLSGELFPNQVFGTSVAVERGQVLVGAPCAFRPGVAYLFRKQGGVWTQTAQLVGADSVSADSLAFSVALSDGTAILGARRQDSMGSNAGAAYLFGLFLCGDADQISLGAGGAQVLDLTAGDVHAGDAYMLLGSMTGTVGFPLAGFVVPLDVDPYLVFTLIHPNTGPLFQSLGILDGSGRASALFALPPGFTPSLAGVTVHHAYGVVDFASGTPEEVSNPVGVELVP